MARDALTNDEFRAVVRMLAEVGDLRQIIRAHPHIDPAYFERNKVALQKAAKLEGGVEAVADRKADAAAERAAEKKEEAAEDAPSKPWHRK